MQTQIIQTARFDFQRIYVKAAPAKTTKAAPAKAATQKAAPAPQAKAAPDLAKFVRTAKAAQAPAPVPQVKSIGLEITATIERPHLPKITPLAKIAPLPKVAPLPKIAPAPLHANYAAYTAESIFAEIDGLNKRADVARHAYNTNKCSKATFESEILTIKALLKEACFIRSKLAPIPTLPKLKTVNFHDKKTGDVVACFIGNDAQIFKHLKEVNTAQRVASKAGKPFEGLIVSITHNQA